MIVKFEIYILFIPLILNLKKENLYVTCIDCIIIFSKFHFC